MKWLAKVDVLRTLLLLVLGLGAFATGLVVADTSSTGCLCCVAKCESNTCRECCEKCGCEQ